MTAKTHARRGSDVTLQAASGRIKSLRDPVYARVKTARGTVDGVIMKADNYEALRDYIEDLEARRAFDNTRDQESFPLEIADRLIDGENPIRVFRKYRGMTLNALARAAKLSKGYLSEIETGKKPGSVKALRRIADALGVDVDNLL